MPGQLVWKRKVNIENSKYYERLLRTEKVGWLRKETKKIKRTLVSSYTREERLAKDRDHKRMKLANESQEAKAARLAKRREKYHAQKLQNPKIYQTPKVTD